MYHITPDGPGNCSATIGTCPYGKPVDHFDNIADAQRFYEKQMFEQNGKLTSATKKSVSARYAAKSLKLTGTDKTIADLKIIKQKPIRNTKKDFIKKHNHILTPVSQREQAELKHIQGVLANFKK